MLWHLNSEKEQHNNQTGTTSWVFHKFTLHTSFDESLALLASYSNWLEVKCKNKYCDGSLHF